MNIYTRRRGTQEAAGSKSGGGGQSERSAERPAGAEWRDGEMLVLSSSDVYSVVFSLAALSPTPAAHERQWVARKLAQLNVARYF